MKRVVMIGMFLLSSAGFAQTPTEKSVAIVTLLGVDPIGGDALLYAGKPGQAAGSFALSLGSILAAGYGIGTAIACEEEACENDGVAEGFFCLGIAGYLSSLAWDLAGGIQGVHEHNERLRQASTVKPHAMILPNGGHVGVTWAF